MIEARQSIIRILGRRREFVDQAWAISGPEDLSWQLRYCWHESRRKSNRATNLLRAPETPYSVFKNFRLGRSLLDFYSYFVFKQPIMEPLNQCTKCGKNDAPDSLKLCSKCKNMKYCVSNYLLRRLPPYMIITYGMHLHSLKNARSRTGRLTSSNASLLSQMVPIPSEG